MWSLEHTNTDWQSNLLRGIWYLVNQKIEQNSKSSCTGSMLVKFKTIPSKNRDSSHVSPGEISSLYLELWPIDTFTRFHASG